MRVAVLAAAVVVLVLATGCTTVRITATTRSSVEQRLLVRAIERAAARLDAQALEGRRIRLEMFGLTPDHVFARELFRARLQARGLRVSTAADADVTLQVFATALAVDTADTLLGVPSMQVPILAVPIPEIALFKWERSTGYAQVQLYAYDAAGQFIGQRPDVRGESRYHRFTILIFINFSVSDIDETPHDPP